MRTIAIHRSIGAQAHPTPFWFHYDYHEKFTRYFARVLSMVFFNRYRQKDDTQKIANRTTGLLFALFVSCRFNVFERIKLIGRNIFHILVKFPLRSSLTIMRE